MTELVQWSVFQVMPKWQTKFRSVFQSERKRGTKFKSVFQSNAKTKNEKRNSYPFVKVMRKRKTKTDIDVRFSKWCENEIRSSKPFSEVRRKRKTKSKIQICFSMPCENEKYGYGTWIHFSYAIEKIKRLALRYTHYKVPENTKQAKSSSSSTYFMISVTHANLLTNAEM